MDISIEIKLEKIHALIQKKEETIENLQYEIDLLKDDGANVINLMGKRNGIYYYTIPRIEGTNRWLNKRDSVDKRLKDEDKDHYHRLIATLTSWVGESVKDITNIVEYGYDCYAYGIDFVLSTDAEYTYRLDVPNYGHIGPEHLYDVKWGMLALYKCKLYENVNYLRAIWCDYDINSLKDVDVLRSDICEE